MLVILLIVDRKVEMPKDGDKITELTKISSDKIRVESRSPLEKGKIIFDYPIEHLKELETSKLEVELPRLNEEMEQMGHAISKSDKMLARMLKSQYRSSLTSQRESSM